MGKTVAKVFGISTKKPDTSAYDRQIAEQKAATEKAEAEAAAKQAEMDAANQRREQANQRREQAAAYDAAGRTSLIRTGAEGDMSTTSVKRKTLLGG